MTKAFKLRNKTCKTSKKKIKGDLVLYDLMMKEFKTEKAQTIKENIATFCHQNTE